MKKGIIKDRMMALLLCELAFGGLAIAGTILGLNNSYKMEKERNAIVSEAGYDEYNAEYKKEQASDLLEQFKNGELSEYEYSKATASLKDYSVETFMNEHASAEYLEEYKAILKSDKKPYVYYGMFCAGFLGTIGVCYFSYKYSYKDDRKDSTNSQKIKMKNGKSLAVEPLVKEDFAIEEVLDCLKLTNSMAEPSQETKERDK